MARKIRSKEDLRFCPVCGERTRTKGKPVRSAIIDGERVTTKTNRVVECPRHGELYL